MTNQRTFGSAARRVACSTPPWIVGSGTSCGTADRVAAMPSERDQSQGDDHHSAPKAPTR